ncbi:hypothetical protein KFU94_64875 [Chloroflexi bacterium TSY]|nr:hypothetical protein [Chloroflexi bacterium TSY]
MLTGEALTNHLTKEFTQSQATLLSKVITDAYTDLVKTGDFNELKEIVRDLGAAQTRTELRMDELAEAQKRTEQRMDELAEAQKRTEIAMASLAETTERMSKDLAATRSELAGLSSSFGYALENEAYRSLPQFLQEEHGITVDRRFIREYVRDREINLLAEAHQDGEPILIVGESKTRLGADDFRQLFDNIEAVRQAQADGELPNYRILPLLITHMARPQALRRADREGVIVIQSFEW